MTLLLVRHAAAGDRDNWTGDDRRRPLTAKGARQADDLVELLAEYDIKQVISSPYLRCVQTVEPIVASMGVDFRVSEELAEGHGAAGLGLIRGLTGTTLLCGHGDNVPAMLIALGIDWDGRCKKGSTWVVDDGRMSAKYVPPPG